MDDGIREDLQAAGVEEAAKQDFMGLVQKYGPEIVGGLAAAALGGGAARGIAKIGTRRAPRAQTQALQAEWQQLKAAGQLDTPRGQQVSQALWADDMAPTLQNATTAVGAAGGGALSAGYINNQRSQ